MRRTPRRRSRRSPHRGKLALAAVFTILIGVNTYIFGFRQGTSVKDLIALSGDKEMAQALIPTPPKKGAAKAAAKGAPAPAAPGSASPSEAARAGRPQAPVAEPALPEAALSGEDARVAEGVVRAGETLAGIMKREGVAPKTAGEIAAALGRLFDVRTVRAGHEYALRFDAEDRPRALEYRTSPSALFRVERAGGAAGPEIFRVNKETAPPEVKIAAIGGTVETTLVDAVRGAGEGPPLAAALQGLFAGDLDFQADAGRGDRFRLLVEKVYLGDRFFRYGRVLAAEYTAKAGTLRAYRWDPPSDGDAPARAGGFYDDEGEAMGKTLLKTPLRLLGAAPAPEKHRPHAVPHTERGQLGVDYAAPAGTPVWATAGGKVTWKGPKPGAGECVMLAHPGGMETMYSHLQRYAKGLEVGQSVRQRQVIGYVGATGLPSGTPHLHFGVKMGGHFVDPLRLHPARESPLPPAERPRYLASIASRQEQLAKIDVRPRREPPRTP